MNLGRENEQQEYKESTSELNDAMDDISAILNKHQKGVLYFCDIKKEPFKYL